MLSQTSSDHKLAPAALELIEAMPLLVWTCTPDGWCDYLSPQWVEYTGVPASQQLGYAWVEVLHPDDRERAAAHWKDATVGRSHYDLEYRIRRCDGVYRWFKTRGVPQSDSSGALVRWIGACTDIDAQKAAEERLCGLLASISDGVMIIDQNWRVLFVNERVAAYARAEPAEMIGSLLWDRFPDVKGSRFELEAARAFETGREVRYEQFNSGRNRWFELDIFPHAANIIVFTRDITDRRLFEQKVQQEAKHDSLGILAGGVAHDFNNLLVGIMGNVSLALDILDAQTPVRAMLEDAVIASERAALLTRQLLAYAGKAHVTIENLDISQLVRDTRQLIRTHIPSYVELRLILDDDLPPVAGDFSQIQQVIMNLIINAAESIDASKPGDIRVYTSLERSRYVCLIVKDEGAGMTEETAGRIFEPFFTTKFTGRGLGLAAAQGIVRSHKGSLRVESTPGIGTTFTVLLPVCTKGPS